MTTTKSQKYSQIVFLHVDTYRSNTTEREVQRKYKGLCKRAGGLLRTMGLMQFVAYLMAKGTHNNEAHHLMLLGQLRDSLHQAGIAPRTNHDEAFRDWIANRNNVPEYMRVTREVLAFLYWHKQFADILIEGNADDNGEDE
jgi:CRISPR type III-B/RAMP module-associated protein Cmr5